MGAKSSMTQTTSFPIVPLAEVPAAVTLAAATGYRPLVLVVDDEAVIADTLAAILIQGGFAAVAAYDGPGAMDTALLIPPQLLLADVVLPGMTGIELAVEVERLYPDCKILLFSGQTATREMLSQANRNGHQFELLHKPIQPKALLARMAEGFS